MNMKPFNLERALAGDPVVTRDGKKVEQIAHFPSCRDDSEKVITTIDGMVHFFYENGTYYYYRESTVDLFMLEQNKKIDMSKCAIGMPVLVSVDAKLWYKRHYAGNNKVFTTGQTEWSSEFDTSLWNYMKLAFDALFIPWFGGEQPLPDGVIVEIVFRNSEKVIGRSDTLDWPHNCNNLPTTVQIIAYRAIGLAEGWEF